LTGITGHRNDVIDEQGVSRNSMLTLLYFIFFPTEQNILKFCPPHIGTFNFVPTAQAKTRAKQIKEISPPNLLNFNQ
jgi:hypothetical protein